MLLLPRVTPPLVNVIVPVAVEALTVAVNVSEDPTLAGFADDTSVTLEGEIYV